MSSVSTIRLGLAIAGLGLLGVASSALMTVEVLAPEPVTIPVPLLRLLSLINPALLVIGAAWIGAVLAPRVGLEAPAIRQALAGHSPLPVLQSQASAAAIAGILVGLLLAAYSVVTQPYFASLGPEAATRAQALTPPFIMRILYGGIAEEVIARWGVMTLAVWVLWRVLGRSSPTPPGIHWTGIVIAALLFALGHLPLLYALTGGAPLWLMALVIAVNGVAGTVFGWLFWRKGLEAAMIAHALAHLAAISLGWLGAA